MKKTVLMALTLMLFLQACGGAEQDPGRQFSGESEPPEVLEPVELTPDQDGQAAADSEPPAGGWRETVSGFLQEIPGVGDYVESLPAGDSLFVNRAPDFYYYQQLSGEEQALYDAMWMVVQDPTSTEYRKKVSVSVDPSSDIFETEITHAMHALENDHPELFWLKQNGTFHYYYLDMPDRSGSYSLMVQLSDTYDAYQEEMSVFNAAVADFMAGIDLTAPDPLIALEIHDKLIDLVSYDEVLASEEAAGATSDYGYTAYGALVANSRGEAHTAVCDGYTYAYQYLLQQAGIMAVRVAGYAGDSAETAGGHSWNVIRLDDGWYEVDATWDDNNPGFDQQDPDNWLLNEAVNDWNYWDRIRHYMYGLTTAEISSFVPDDSFTYYYESDEWTGHASFLGSSVHIRDTEAQQEITHDYITYLAPEAYGTTYTYDYLVNWRWQRLQEAQTDGYTEDSQTDGYTEDGYTEDGYSDNGYIGDGYSEEGYTEDTYTGEY